MNISVGILTAPHIEFELLPSSLMVRPGDRTSSTTAGETPASPVTEPSMVRPGDRTSSTTAGETPASPVTEPSMVRPGDRTSFVAPTDRGAPGFTPPSTPLPASGAGEFTCAPGGFLLKNVRIGIGFHWDRHEDQIFEGSLTIRKNADGTETAINTLPLEDYLTSVISSEMSADSPLELLKAHAVISRSWAIRAIGHTEHVGFDVCADDHCQRYEGLLRRNERAVQAVRETEGQVLLYGDEVCDCRYYKCCGGKTERFSTCWEDIDMPYLQPVDCPYCGKAVGNTRLQRLVLNNYDQETHDFHDWEVRYTAEELADIIREKTGIDFGEIVSLRPLKRGISGRIYELEIIGTKHRAVISKELKIRQVLSRTCLYSSWFDVEEVRMLAPNSRGVLCFSPPPSPLPASGAGEFACAPGLSFSMVRSGGRTSSTTAGEMPASPVTKPSMVRPGDRTSFVAGEFACAPHGFIFRGHGWGHGVGLCQIGAAEMAMEGFTYQQILAHYYPSSVLSIYQE